MKRKCFAYIIAAVALLIVAGLAACESANKPDENENAEIKEMMRNWELITFPYDSFTPAISFVTEQASYSTSIHSITAHLSIADEEQIQTIGWSEGFKIVKFVEDEWLHVPLTSLEFIDLFQMLHPGGFASFTITSDNLFNLDYFIEGTYRFVTSVSYSPYISDYTVGAAIVWAEFEITE